MTQSERCPVCGKPYRKPGGRPLRISDEQIAEIIRHYRAEEPKHTIKRFCELQGISPYTYRLVAYMRLKMPQDRERVQRIAEQV